MRVVPPLRRKVELREVVEFDGATKIESLAPGAFVGTICLEQASCRNG